MTSQQATVKQIAEDSVVLSVNKSTVYWPKDDLKHVQVGDEVHLVAMTTDDFEKHKNNLAKSILNNVLQPKHD